MQKQMNIQLTQNIQMLGQQRGAVLLISLIILTVMSVLTISGMDSALTNEQMAANHQFREVSFQVADSGGEFAVSQSEWVNTTLAQLEVATPNWPTYDVDFGDGVSTLTVGMEARQTPLPGNSIRQGVTFTFYTIETLSQAQSYQNVPSTIIKGFTRAGAG